MEEPNWEEMNCFINSVFTHDQPATPTLPDLEDRAGHLPAADRSQAVAVIIHAPPPCQMHPSHKQKQTHARTHARTHTYVNVTI